MRRVSQTKKKQKKNGCSDDVMQNAKYLFNIAKEQLNRFFCSPQISRRVGLRESSVETLRSLSNT